MDNRTKSNYNKIEYCLDNGLELLSAPTVFAVCQDSSVLIDFDVIDFEGATVIDKGNYHVRKTLESWHTAKTVGADNNSKPLPRQYSILL